jgi:hypothetical protein
MLATITRDRARGSISDLARILIAAAMMAGAFLVSAGLAQAQCTGQQARLLGAGSSGLAQLGYSVAISSDGNTAIAGAPFDNSNVGATHVYVRSGTTWTQQGPKLTPTGAVGTNGIFGNSVALSSDGNTALVGASGDNSNVGAAYVFVRSGISWAQQAKLLPTGGAGAGNFGGSVSLSADGNNAAIGADNDNGSVGAAYIFVRAGATWSQQGPKLVPTGALGPGRLGIGTALSGDGTTAAFGARFDNGTVGAAYIFTRSGAAWAQQAKLIPTGGAGASQVFGSVVSLSNDGNIALAGASADASNTGAVFVFTRAGTTWSQQGPKLVPADGAGAGSFGSGLSLSGDGTVAVIGAKSDNSNTGASYVFARSGTTWSQQGSKLIATGTTGSSPGFGFSAAISGDSDTGIFGACFENGSVGAVYTFAIRLPITFTQHPTNASVRVGSNAIFSVAATSNTPLTYQWRRSGVPLVTGPSGTGSTVSGATTPTLTITGATAADNGAAFDCAVTNACGPARSDPAGLAVTGGCGSADFDGDGDTATDADIEAFFRVLAGGSC